MVGHVGTSPNGCSHPKQVLVVFFNSSDFEPICVPISMTTLDILEHHDIATRLDMYGTVNRGLFLKTTKEEHMFDSNECPCEAIFFINDGGCVVRKVSSYLAIIGGRWGGGGGAISDDSRGKGRRDRGGRGNSS